MYRSQKLYEKMKDETFDIYPICVPSYNRADAAIFKALDTYPDLPLILFIRNTPEQKKLYRKYKERCRIVLLKDVVNIGQTRRAIVNWCVENRIPQIFMMDDDIDELDFLYPHETSNGNLCMRAARQNMNRSYKGVNPFTLRMWMWWIKKCNRKDLTITTPAYRPDSWHLKNKNAEVVYNRGACIQCIHLNVRNLYKNGINYRDTEECGTEDYALQYDVMKAGLTTAVFRDLMYGCPAVGSLEGGNEDACGHSPLQERYIKFCDLFMKNVLKDDPPEGIKIKVTTRSQIPSIKFNWEYWKVEEKDV